MNNLRYGKFQFDDYCSAWLMIIFLFTVGIMGFFLDVCFWYCLCYISLAIYMLMSIVIPNLEHFLILDNAIVICRGNKKRTVTIPAEPILIISYADICPPLAKRVSIGNQTYMLKGKYAVSILQNVTLTTALECLHRNRIRKYTTNTIEASFYDYQYIYSFVCNQSLLEQLTADRKCLLIVPESLVDEISVTSYAVNIHIDTGY